MTAKVPQQPPKNSIKPAPPPAPPLPHESSADYTKRTGTRTSRLDGRPIGGEQPTKLTAYGPDGILVGNAALTEEGEWVVSRYTANGAVASTFLTIEAARLVLEAAGAERIIVSGGRNADA
jgi:hypothetical protein